MNSTQPGASRLHFSRDYFPPQGLSFAGSDALFPPQELARELAGEYERQCRALCFGSSPAWTEVQGRFEEQDPGVAQVERGDVVEGVGASTDSRV